MSEQMSIQSYNNLARAKDYHSKTGFDPQRKEKMLDVALNLLMDLTPKESSILELGAGTGLFTNKLMMPEHFSKMYITDGAKTMLEMAKNTLKSSSMKLTFELLDFTQEAWAEKYNVNAVTSSKVLWRYITQKIRNMCFLRFIMH